MKLEAAVKSGDVDQVKQLIAQKSRRDLRSTGMTWLLGQAAYAGHQEIIQVLLEAGVEPNDLDRIIYPHEAPLAQAAHKGHLNIVQLLLDFGAEVNIPSDDPEYLTPLMCAAYSGNLNIVKLLVESGADVNTIRNGGSFALMIAAERGYQDIFECLAPLSDPELREIASRIN